MAQIRQHGAGRDMLGTEVPIHITRGDCSAIGGPTARAEYPSYRKDLLGFSREIHESIQFFTGIVGDGCTVEDQCFVEGVGKQFLEVFLRHIEIN